MKLSQKKHPLLIAGITAALVFALAGCASTTSKAPQDTSPSQEESAAPTGGTEAPVGSLMAAHTLGQLDGVALEDMTSKFCLSCHPRSAISEATQDYGGTPGYNPHKSHYDAGACTNCHSVDGQSVLACDECHTEDCPEGWIPAPRGENPVWDLKKAFKE